MNREHDVSSSVGGKIAYDSDNSLLLVMHGKLWAGGYDGDGTDHTTYFFFSSRRRHTRLQGDWSSDVCSSDLRLRPCGTAPCPQARAPGRPPARVGRRARSRERTAAGRSRAHPPSRAPGTAPWDREGGGGGKRGGFGGGRII